MKHGMTGAKLHAVWRAMKARCLNPNSQRYPMYGGRGITICPEWRDSFVSFMTWAMNAGYKEGLTIDRIDNDKGYYPENCRWTTMKVQSRNRRSTRYLTYQGKTQCVSDWAIETGIRRATVFWRLDHGRTLEEIFSRVDKRRKNHEHV